MKQVPSNLFKAYILCFSLTVFAIVYSFDAQAANQTSSKNDPACKLCPAHNPWKEVKKPTSSNPESIGDYSAGCLRGAQTLESDGLGFQVMRPKRNRAFSHPALISYIKKISYLIKSNLDHDLLVGDMGQPRGGPSFSGHASHQSGLDVDLWYWQPKSGVILTPNERDNVSAQALADSNGLTANWNPQVMDMLKIAASQENVERIFVNPAIKKAVCEKHGGESWVRRLRPWYFHHDHFHVRLACQPGSPNCKNQAPAEPGDGCGKDLASWFSSQTRSNMKSMNPPSGGPVVYPVLPEECDAVLLEN